MGTNDHVPHMQEELERHRAEMAELTRGISTIKEGLAHMSDFLELRSMVGRHETEVAGLRQARLNTSSLTLSRGPAESSRLPVPIYSGDPSTLSNFLKIFRTWTLVHDAENAIVTNEPVRVIGEDRGELDNAHVREKANRSVAVWTSLVKEIKRNKTLLEDMIITAGPLFEA